MPLDQSTETAWQSEYAHSRNILTCLKLLTQFFMICNQGALATYLLLLFVSIRYFCALLRNSF